MEEKGLSKEALITGFKKKSFLQMINYTAKYTFLTIKIILCLMDGLLLSQIAEFGTSQDRGGIFYYASGYK